MNPATKYPTLSSAPGSKFTMPPPVCVLQNLFLHAALHEYPGEKPPLMLLRRHTTKPTSTPIDSTGPSPTKKGHANVTSYTLHCQTTATMISDQIHFFNSYYKKFSLTFSISSQTVHELNLHHCNLYLVRLKNPPFCRKSGKKATSLQEVQHSI